MKFSEAIWLTWADRKYRPYVVALLVMTDFPMLNDWVYRSGSRLGMSQLARGGSRPYL